METQAVKLYLTGRCKSSRGWRAAIFTGECWWSRGSSLQEISLAPTFLCTFISVDSWPVWVYSPVSAGLPGRQHWPSSGSPWCLPLFPWFQEEAVWVLPAHFSPLQHRHLQPLRQWPPGAWLQKTRYNEAKVSFRMREVLILQTMRKFNLLKLKNYNT